MNGLLNIEQNISSYELTLSRFIGVSAINLLNAGILANDTQACAHEAKRIYRSLSKGMWRRVNANAKKILRLASQHGLTIEKPYVIKKGIVWGLTLDSFVPLFGKEKEVCK